MTGKQMEYTDHATTCSDCGATLVDQRGVFMWPSELEAVGRLPARPEEEAAERDVTDHRNNPRLAQVGGVG